ncbi:uncharacterized protein TNCV_3800871 [Trichonephila clavipes]|nr:uncharacterized protein TNCV_3800871 [Trichonephila clavipes]
MHNDNCKAHNFRNSGSMEVSGAIEIFQRSKSLHGLQYTKFLGDGDARTFKVVYVMQRYGDTDIEKLKCVAYVEKRMGTRLRALKLKMKGKQLSDKKHWMITVDLQMLKLINCSVIMDWLSETIPILLIVLIQCTNSINSMKRAIWATYFHKASIDTYPQHGLCPTNEDTWCKYNRAITTGEVYKHKKALPS